MEPMGIETLELIRDEDDEIVGEVWRVARIIPTGEYRVYLRAMVHCEDGPKRLGSHMEVADAVREIHEYWGMIR